MGLQLQANAKKLKRASLLVPGLNKFHSLAQSASPKLSKVLPGKLGLLRSPGSAKEIEPTPPLPPLTSNAPRIHDKSVATKSSDGSPGTPNSRSVPQTPIQNAQVEPSNTLAKAASFLKRNTDKEKKKTRQTVMEENTCIVTCEILDPTTHTMIMQNPAIAHMSDYVLSNDTVSKVLAMVAESREVKTVLKELLGSQGCDIMVYSPGRYCDLKAETMYSFWELFDRVRMRGEILLGWIHSEDGLSLNPKG